LPGLVADNQNTCTFPSPAEQSSENETTRDVFSLVCSRGDENMTTLDMLKERQAQYKRAAVQAKKTGNSNLAIQYVRIVKV
jgi:hypothetical protein